MVLANDPLFSREAWKEYTDKHDSSSKKRLMKSYADQTSDPAKEAKHDMDHCTIFNEQTVEDRSKALANEKLCYECYMQITADHNTRTCSNGKICKICDEKSRQCRQSFYV